ncbi:MAG TPA: TetR/AcrR family transcriptional regulator [Firmicutes bacterium]|nr:TetR/AcrR family transcriptional regulator [Bacillota bacterium]
MLIRKSFTKLLSLKPIQSISVKELCEEAGINRGTFYTHYKDLYDLRDSIEEEALDDFKEAMKPLLAEDGPNPVKVTAGIFQFIKDNSDLCIVTLGPYGDKLFLLKLLNIGRQTCMDSYTKYFEKASPKKLEYYYAFASMGCIGLLQKWLDEGMVAPAEEIAQAAEEFMTGGLEYLK